MIMCVCVSDTDHFLALGYLECPGERRVLLVWIMNDV